MKNRSIKIEKYRMWFSDLKGTAALFKEKSCEGWHVCEMEVETGKFTYKKQEPKNYSYLISVNGECEDFSIYDEDSGYEKIAEDAGLAVFRREEDGEKAHESVKKSFSSIEEEEKWLSEQAAEGCYLLRCQRPEYVFMMCENTECKFKADYAPEVKNKEEYLEKFKNAGWQYVCGGDGYHYFASESGKKSNEEVFDTQESNKQVSESKRGQYISFLAMSLFGGALALLKMFFDYKRYSGGADMGETGKSLIMDIAALVICLCIAAYGLVKFIIEKSKKI